MKYIKSRIDFINEKKSNNLNEGQFSWMTQDSNKQIGSEKQNTIDVYMYDNEGNKWKETRYDGYGNFGGMDFYDLVATMNGYDADREKGIDLAFGKLKTKDKKRKTLFPALVEDPRYNWKRHNFTEQPENDPNQSWYQEEEDDRYGYDDYYESTVTEGKGWNDVARVMDAGLKKAIKKGIINLRYAQDYVKSLERMAKKNAKQFFNDYGDFTEDDFIEDVRYNMANEKVNEGKGDKAVSMAQKKLDKVIGDLKANLLKFKSAKTDADKETFKSEAKRLTKLRKDAHDNLEDAISNAYAEVELVVMENYDTDQRKEMASKGLALPDGSFPIKNLEDLKNAIQAYGRAKDQSKAAKFIAKRAKALSAEDLIPNTEDFQKALKEASFGRIPKFGKN